MTKLEIRRLNVQKNQVAVAREALELSIAERENEIANIQAMIEVSKAKEAELQKQIDEAEKA